MQGLAAGIGDLKRVLSNVKVMGYMGRGAAGADIGADPDA